MRSILLLILFGLEAQTDPFSFEEASPPPLDALAEIEKALSCPPKEAWPADMACVLGGRFERGDPRGRPDEKPVAEVFVNTFYMDLREVTNEDYEKCIAEKRCTRPVRFPRFMGAKQPVVAVSWHDAQAFCEMMGKRLATEAEWERAARGPENERFSWGSDSDACSHANVESSTLGKGCGADRTRPVGSYSPGYWGLYDMGGNVHEWVLDWYSSCYRGCEDECGDGCFVPNPKGPCDGAPSCKGRKLRVVRGGSWWWPAERARGAARRGSGPLNRGPHRFGFRCAKDL